MSRESFIAKFGDVYEHSPWIAGKIYDEGLDERHEVPGYLHEAFRSVIAQAGKVPQMTLLRAHPQLACGLAGLTESSRHEQAAASLDQCSAEEFDEFAALNKAYLTRFTFPFIIAVRGWSRAQILETFRRRIESDPETEFTEALEQVCLIGKYRLAEKFRG